MSPSPPPPKKMLLSGIRKAFSLRNKRVRLLWRTAYTKGKLGSVLAQWQDPKLCTTQKITWGLWSSKRFNLQASTQLKKWRMILLQPFSLQLPSLQSGLQETMRRLPPTLMAAVATGVSLRQPEELLEGEDEIVFSIGYTRSQI